ncbi:LPS export ABC transporter permease LptF [Sulfitobacter aestuarii]|uniref:LPS export ABC transporter permease LptF n=1 Tax=Sulfitobacter aestuarii TaxID=2161676 RepID=A0ABW5TZR4_9RHOB
MARFDRYMLSQLLVLFGFFALVLVALFWINRAVLLFDRLIGDGQSALIFLEFSALSLPKLITTVLPIAAFAAAAYVTNRMSNESELAVLQATGTGPWRLARPVLVYGLCVAVMMSILTHILLPMAQEQLELREREIAQNVTARLLSEGTFLHPSPQVTFYTRAIGADGVLHDVFLSDRRKPREAVIYTASEAYLVRNGEGTTLIMVDGMAQRLNREDQRLATANFQDFSFDISGLMRREVADDPSSANMTTPQMLGQWAALEDVTGESAGDIAEELHARFAQPLFCLVAALIGFATLLVGGYSRFGVWREIVIAFGLLLVIDGLRSSLVDVVQDNAALWPLIYLPSLIGGLLVLALLAYAAHPGWLSRRRREVAA